MSGKIMKRNEESLSSNITNPRVYKSVHGSAVPDVVTK